MMRGDILIVDDHESVRGVLREILEEEGVTVRVAADGETALAMAAERPPDLVFLDLSMPDMDGLEVLRRLRADPRTAAARVVIVTARAEEERGEGVALGATEYFTKPFSPLAVLRLVDRLLRPDAETAGPGEEMGGERWTS